MPTELWIALLSVLLPILVSVLAAAFVPLKHYLDLKVEKALDKLPQAEHDFLNNLAAAVVVAVQQQHDAVPGPDRKALALAMFHNILNSPSVKRKFPKVAGISDDEVGMLIELSVAAMKAQAKDVPVAQAVGFSPTAEVEKDLPEPHVIGFQPPA